MTEIPYRPADLFEAQEFSARLCVRCRDFSRASGLGYEACRAGILEASYAYRVTDPWYPAALVRDPDGRPTCTAFTEADA